MSRSPVPQSERRSTSVANSPPPTSGWRRPLRPRRFVPALGVAALLAAASSARAGSYLVFVDDEAGFEGSLSISPASTIVDSGGAFAPDPVAATGLSSVSRSGTVGGQTYAFTVYDVNFVTGDPPGTLTPGSAGGDVSSASAIDVETPVAQGGATGSGTFGYDSSSGSPSSRNALLVDFTTSPGGAGIGHFALDLVDFEALTEGTEGWLRLYDGGVLVFSQAFSFPGDGGDGATHFLGVVAADTSSFFDQVVLVVGDDTAGGSGNAETWAADRLRFGAAHNPEPGTLTLFGAGLAGIAAAVRRRRARAATQRGAVSPGVPEERPSAGPPGAAGRLSEGGPDAPGSP